MKICVFSDIHGNLEAFNAARVLIAKESADMNIFLGDLCGYYFDELAVWQKLIKIPNLTVLRGNHDDIFLRAANGDKAELEKYSAKYGPALKLFLKKNYNEMAVWLDKLPLSWECSESSCSGYHGSPWDPLNEYIYPDAPLERFRDIKEGLVFLGHTHYSMDKSNGKVRIINPGSIGQPRDGHWPSFTVVDTVNMKACQREIRYDKDAFIRKVRKMAPHEEYLHDVIGRMS
jgi:putative phosphoesterase